MPSDFTHTINERKTTISIHGLVGQPRPKTTIYLDNHLHNDKHYGAKQDLSAGIKYQRKDHNTAGYENPKKPLRGKRERRPRPAVVLTLQAELQG